MFEDTVMTDTRKHISKTERDKLTLNDGRLQT